VAGVDFKMVGELHESLERFLDLAKVAAGQIRAADPVFKQGVARKNTCLADNANAVRRVAGCFNNF
jgi:hypothetical protein